MYFKDSPKRFPEKVSPQCALAPPGPSWRLARQSFAVQLWAEEELHLRAEPGEDSTLMVHGKKVILGWKAGACMGMSIKLWLGGYIYVYIYVYIYIYRCDIIF